MPAVTSGVVAVTGASGFIGSYIVKELLEQGFQVRACVRDKDDTTKTAHLAALTQGSKGSVAFFSTDLSQDGSFDEAFAGADAVIHSAAVVEINKVSDPYKAIINPSVEGTKNVLKSIDKSGTVKRLVHTSSISAIMNANKPSGTVFTENDWNEYSTVATGDAYGFAKKEAEMLVWKHVKDQGKSYDVTTIQPSVVLGPCMTKAHTKASSVVIRQLLYGNSQPNYFSTFVDVRDVAKIHVEALKSKKAENERFIAANTDSAMWIVDLEKPTRRLFPDYAISGRTVASWKIWLAWFLSFIPLIGSVFMTGFQSHFCHKEFKYDSGKVRNTLGIKFTNFDTTIKDTVNSMVDTGFVKPRMKRK